MIENELLERWVEEVSNKTKPDQIKWCDGSEDEYQYLINLMIKNGTLIELNQAKYPGCYLHRSNKGDVARTENSTFVCTINEEDAGPTNNFLVFPRAGRTVLMALMFFGRLEVFPTMLMLVASTRGIAQVRRRRRIARAMSNE